jgi:hypothetical protein
MSSAGSGAGEAPGKTGKSAGGEGRGELTGDPEFLTTALGEGVPGEDDDSNGAVEQAAMGPAATRSRPIESGRGIEVVPPWG